MRRDFPKIVSLAAFCACLASAEERAGFFRVARAKTLNSANLLGALSAEPLEIPLARLSTAGLPLGGVAVRGVSTRTTCPPLNNKPTISLERDGEYDRSLEFLEQFLPLVGGERAGLKRSASVAPWAALGAGSR